MKRNMRTMLALLLLTLAIVACGGATTTALDTGADMETDTGTEVIEEPTEEMVEEPTEEMMEEPTEEAAETGADATTLGTEENPIVMSFVPSGDSQEIVSSGEEIAEMLEMETGLAIEANVATSYAAVVEAMGAGNAHVGWLNTFAYILANERYGADVALSTIRFGTPYYTGQIIANADSEIETLEDIEGKTVCWVDPLSTSGYIIPRIMLAAAGVDVDALDSQIAGSHPNVVSAVYAGDCDAGATFVDARTAIAEEFPDVNDRVEIIAESPEIPNDTVTFIAEMPEELRQQIVDALLTIADTEEGGAALERVYEIEGLQEVDDSFYDAFRTELDASGIDIEELAGE